MLRTQMDRSGATLSYPYPLVRAVAAAAGIVTAVAMIGACGSGGTYPLMSPSTWPPPNACLLWPLRDVQHAVVGVTVSVVHVPQPPYVQIEEHPRPGWPKLSAAHPFTLESGPRFQVAACNYDGDRSWKYGQSVPDTGVVSVRVYRVADLIAIHQWKGYPKPPTGSGANKYYVAGAGRGGSYAPDASGDINWQCVDRTGQLALTIASDQGILVPDAQQRADLIEVCDRL